MVSFLVEREGLTAKAGEHVSGRWTCCSLVTFRAQFLPREAENSSSLLKLERTTHLCKTDPG